MRRQNWLYTIPLRVRSLFNRASVEQELDAELRDHLEQKAAHYRASGLSADDARRAALRDFEGLELRKEQCRDTRRVRPLEDLVQDIRYSLRAIRKSPGFTATALLTLALGIGANAAIFSVINAVLLRSLPYSAPEEIVAFSNNQSLPDLEDIQKQATSFSSIGGLNRQPVAFTGHGDPVQVTAGFPALDFFATLGVQPQIGRLYTAEEDRYGGPSLVILTHGFWSRFFGSDPSVLGQSIHLDGVPYTVIGVMRPDFWVPGKAVDVLLPLRIGSPLAAKFRGVHFLKTFARLKPSASLAKAAAEMQGIDTWLSAQYPENDRDIHRRLIPVREWVVGDVRLELLLVFAAVGVVLLIACVNFASLQLARSATRRREIAVRAALGAPTFRLVRQIVTESALLSLFGGIIGLLFAFAGVRLLMLLKPEGLPRIETTSVDISVLLFTFVLSLFTGIVFGLIPAFSAAFSRNHAHLKEDARASSGGASGFRIRRILVVSEVALALILLVSASLLLRSFALLHQVDLGFRSDNLLTLRLDLPDSRYHEQEKQRAFHDQLLEGLNSTPGVHAALVSEVPMSGDWLTHNTVIEGRSFPVGAEPEIQTRSIAGDYFRVMGIPLLAGRDFNSTDHTGSLHVAVVNRAFAETYFPSQNPLGARVDWARSQPPYWMTIVGVVGDVKHFGPSEPEQPAIYDLYSQTAQVWKRWMSVVVQSDAAPGATLALVKQHLAALDSQLPITQVSTMSDVFSASLDHQRFNLSLFTVFALVALALAIVGIYGVISYSVTQRTAEIGIRVALGAQRRDILSLILGQGARLSVFGASLGILAAFAVTRYLSHFLFNVSPRDPGVFLAIPIFLCALALLASYLPARRAVRSDPVRALRYE
jgi:putative ABC transport system permease protein